jgi:hypothetical protein
MVHVQDCGNNRGHHVRRQWLQNFDGHPQPDHVFVEMLPTSLDETKHAQLLAHCMTFLSCTGYRLFFN